MTGMRAIALVLAGLMLVAFAPGVGQNAEPSGGPAAKGETKLKVVNIYADEKGVSHFRDIEIELEPLLQAGGVISKPVKAGEVWYRIAPADQDAKFHTAPRKQLVITLQGGT